MLLLSFVSVAYCIVFIDLHLLLCIVDAAQKIRETYLNGSEQEKQELVKKFGQKQLKKLVEEHFSEQWLQENSKKCPRCFAQVQVC